MSPILRIICAKEPEIPDLSLAKIVQLLGLQHRFIFLDDFKDELSCFYEGGAGTKLFLAFSYSTLIKISEHEKLNDLQIVMERKSACTLIYCINPVDPKNGVLAKVTGNAIKNVSFFGHDAFEYKIAIESRPISREFAGLSFGPINCKYDFTIEPSILSPGVENIITINNAPLFLRLMKNGSELFFLSVGEILDIESPSEQPLDTKTYFSRLVPIMMFLKFVFGDYCWHPINKQACLVIDDPLIRKKYGFLEYRTLLSLMRKKNFSTSIGFIPWNYNRTDKETARLLRNNDDKFSISVHGCNHTDREFALADSETINGKIGLSTERMELHAKSHGLHFDRIMVFPQGVFSAKCMSVLKANNYLAAVNTEAVSSDNTLKLKLCDFMKPAILDYYEFPLFLRRYPRGVPDCAFDLFLGRPLIIVIHHDYLKDRYRGLIKLIQKINAIDHGIKWNSLEKIIQQSYWERATSGDTVYVEVYAGRAKIRNISGRKLKYVIIKRENWDIPVLKVKVNGSAARYEVNQYGLLLIRDMEADEIIDFEVIYQDIYGSPALKREGVIENQKIRIRRFLSEVRDNILSRNSFLLTTSNRIKRLLS